MKREGQAFKRREPEHVSVSCNGADGVELVEHGTRSEGTLDRGLPSGHWTLDRPGLSDQATRYSYGVSSGRAGKALWLALQVSGEHLQRNGLSLGPEPIGTIRTIPPGNARSRPLIHRLEWPWAWEMGMSWCCQLSPACPGHQRNHLNLKMDGR